MKIAALNEQQFEERLEKLEQKLSLLVQQTAKLGQIVNKISDFVIHSRLRCRCGAWESIAMNETDPRPSSHENENAAQPTSAVPEELEKKSATEMEEENVYNQAASPSQPQREHQACDQAPSPSQLFSEPVNLLHSIDHAPSQLEPASEPLQSGLVPESGRARKRRRKTLSEQQPFSLAPPTMCNNKKYERIPKYHASTKKHYMEFSRQLDEMIRQAETRVCLMGRYDRTFFTKVLQPRESFSFEVIQECMNGLILRQKKYPNYFDQSVAITDAYFTDIVTTAYKEEDEIHVNRTVKMLMKYCTATHKYWSSIPWKDARAIMIPIFLPSKAHWVACMADMDTSTLVIYDSNFQLFTDSELDSMLKPYTVVLPLTLHKAGCIRSSKPWSWTRPLDIPQSDDCGPFTVKYLELAMNRGDIDSSTVSNDTIQSYRTYLAISIWMRDWEM